MRDEFADIPDPLSINLEGQLQKLLHEIPSTSVHSESLRHASSPKELLSTLSRLLAVSSLTKPIATHFRPLLLDLCARWLDDREGIWAKFEALCLLIEVHEEIYPVLRAFLYYPEFAKGPFTSIPDGAPTMLLHQVLIACYRLLRANRALPDDLLWELTPLMHLFRHTHRGVSWLAIRCYALQARMSDAERRHLEQILLGELGATDCPIYIGESISGVMQEADGWIFPVLEVKRIQDWRERLLEPQGYFAHESNPGHFGQKLDVSDLCQRIVDIHGILLYRSSTTATPKDGFIATQPAMFAMRQLAVYSSLRLPTLLTSPASSGKTTLLNHLLSILYPSTTNQIVYVYLADTSLDPRSLIGSYMTSPTKPGTFEWRDGVLLRAMLEGKWLVLKDIDRASGEVLGLVMPLVESLGRSKRIGTRASIEVPNRGKVQAAESFGLFATRTLEPSISYTFSSPTFLGAHKWDEIIITTPTMEDLALIIDTRFPDLAGSLSHFFIGIWQELKKLCFSQTRQIAINDLNKLCNRVSSLLKPLKGDSGVPSSSVQSWGLQVISDPILKEDIFLEIRDVFLGAGITTDFARLARDAMAALVAERLDIAVDRRDWLLRDKVMELEVNKDADGRSLSIRAGKRKLLVKPGSRAHENTVSRRFAMHKLAKQWLTRICTCVSLQEPVLLTGETGTGKTSLISFLAETLNRPLISLNLSTQSESSDLIGAFRPVDARAPGLDLQHRFAVLFEGTFSRRRNGKFEEDVRKSVAQAKWKRAVKLWKEAASLAKQKLLARREQESSTIRANDVDAVDAGSRKRLKVADADSIVPSDWDAFISDVNSFEIQHVLNQGKFAFAFIEGPLVHALRSGAWVLLDEINLATPETLECIAGIIQGPNGSITLTEKGSLEPVPRHPDFRLFACMNPATDVGKKDLLPHLRSKFTEIDISAPDADRDTLLSIISHYIGGCATNDRAAILDVAEFYAGVKHLSDTRQLANGSNRRPHYSLRTLARALVFTTDVFPIYGLRRSLWEGCLMAFTMVLNSSSAEAVIALARKHILSSVKNPHLLLSRIPMRSEAQLEDTVQFGPFWLNKGPLDIDAADDYILTPSVQAKLIDLARIIVTRRFPVLIEGPTSSGKTSAVQYLARRTGHRFVRINNHEHTDLQEYLGNYVSDPQTGRLAYQDGLLVRALRRGDWIVLDELNLAPTDVLEALNRLLDDNRELVIPETQEVVRPHPHFMLFATQNPPGIYAGRKVLSRALRNRFLEVQFEEVPQEELEAILHQKCCIAPSYAQRIVSVFHELQNRRQADRVFEGKHGFATLRDLFRWAGRDAISYQELADNGYMLLAERARRDDDRQIVKETIEKILNVKINAGGLYDFSSEAVLAKDYLGCSIPPHSQVVWTKAMRRLFVLVARALKYNEPVLLVGETGSGKTSVCQIYAEAADTSLRSINCHQNMEAADLIGGHRPARRRAQMKNGDQNETEDVHMQEGTEASMQIFEWKDGPLVHCMRSGHALLLDEISLADDSVLERLNSVLEPSRTLVLAERSGRDIEESQIMAIDDFKLLATMNPGGDYGKKELSPALRNRFTEIWVPAVSDRQDLEQIVASMWKAADLRIFTIPLLDFTEWLCERVGDRSLATLRDVLAWVNFCETVAKASEMSLETIFVHGALMTFVDGLPSFPQLVHWSKDALIQLRDDAVSELHRLLASNRLSVASNSQTVYPNAEVFQLGNFAIERGNKSVPAPSFTLDAPTPNDNATRVIRACQLTKPILLEGSPGVGKTSLISALADAAGHRLARLNLSDQTDLVDLFGSDLPVEGGRPGEFEWKDAIFLQALQNGDWVLLDEMNLAPQSVLEGLNAVLDHRGTVYIPELDRSFVRHPNFRIFAAQNPVHEGGGRKGLPKSFVNRFTKVYIEALTTDDMALICQHTFRDIPGDVVRQMIEFNSRVNKELSIPGFARQGAPWELNLRDIIRWASLLRSGTGYVEPEAYLNTVYVERFRTVEDRRRICNLFDEVFHTLIKFPPIRPSLLISSTFFQCGRGLIRRGTPYFHDFPSRVLPLHLSSVEAALSAIAQNWLVVVTGPEQSGKKSLICTVAALAGKHLRRLTISSGTDAADLLGGYEQVIPRDQILGVLRTIMQHIAEFLSKASGSHPQLAAQLHRLRWVCSVDTKSVEDHALFRLGNDTLDCFPDELLAAKDVCRHTLYAFEQRESYDGRFEWVDGTLVQAIKSGDWLLLDNVNLCNPSVLDRLNSLCEAGGNLVLSEKGDESSALRAHPNFRLFMTSNPRHGELSRAMRNRGIELHLDGNYDRQSISRLSGLQRVPMALFCDVGAFGRSHIVFDLIRRGLDLCPREVSSPVPFQSSDLIFDDSLSSLCYDYLMLLSQYGASVDQDAIIATLLRLSPKASLRQLSRMISVCSVGQGADLGSRMQYVIESLLSRFDSTIVGTLRERYGSKSQYPNHFVESQPLDLLVNLPIGLQTTSSVLRDQRLLCQAIELYITSTLYELDLQKLTLQLDLSFGSKANVISEQYGGDRLQRGIKESMTLLWDIVAHMNTVISLQSEDLDLVLATCNSSLGLLHLASSLKDVVCTLPLDLSKVYALAEWIYLFVRDRPQYLSALQDNASALWESVSLSSGHALGDIWSALIQEPWPQHILRLQSRLESMFNTDASQSFRVRLRGMELVAVQTLCEEIGTSKETEVQELSSILDSLLPESLQTSQTDGSSRGFAMRLNQTLLILELNSVLSISPLWSAIISEDVQRQIRLSIEFGCKCFGFSLSRPIAYQRLVWAKARLPQLARAHVEWLRALWQQGAENETIVAAPSLLMSSTLFRSTIEICSWDRLSLGTLDDYEQALSLHLVLASSERKQKTGRLEQLCVFFLQSVTMVVLCYPLSFDTSTLELLSHISTNDVSSSFDSLYVLRDSLRSFNASSPGSTFCTALLPPLEMFESDKQSQAQLLRSTAHCWLALARVILSLYVPDIAIDPQVIQHYKGHYWRKQREWILSQLQLHVQAEIQTTGNATNFRIVQLERDLAHLEESSPQHVESSARDGGSPRLSSFWTEIQRFMRDVISDANMNDVLRALAQREQTSFTRKKLIEESIMGFLRRMHMEYAAFDDLMLPVELALHHLRLGLNLFSDAAIVDSLMVDQRMALDISSFPCIAVATSLPVVDTPSLLSSNISQAESLTLQLSGLAYDYLTGVSFKQHLPAIERIYDRLLSLWLVDCSQDKEEQMKSHSLYRLKGDINKVPVDVDSEEVDHETLFPTFEREESDPLPTQIDLDPSVLLTARRAKNVQEESAYLVYILHLSLMSPNTRTKSDLSYTWDRLRLQLVTALLTEQSSSLLESVDLASLPYRLRMLSTQLQKIRNKTDDSASNFYTDHNVLEVRKAVTVLTSLRTRLDVLVTLWPDQMVLQDLRDRCEQLLSQSMSSPVAKVLTSLERLLLQTEDWELHANRDNTLKDHQSALSSLIIEWRRLELSGWRNLLEVQTKLFNDHVAGWWFRLYDVAVHGVSAAVLASDSSSTSALEEYLDELIPLLEQFIKSSPLGQFCSRMTLLKSFHYFVDQLAPSKEEQLFNGLTRIGNVLLSLHQQYDQFSQKVAIVLSEQTRTIEREMATCIKSASWKDTNVWVLQQSARRTHRQLYKSIRKYREILRQPVLPLLSHNEQSADVAAKVDHRDGSTLCQETCHLAVIAATQLQVDSSLPRSYTKFSALLTEGLDSLVSNASAISLEDLSDTIFATMTEFVTVCPPSDISAARRNAWDKSLVARKRKGWADLLKELKRIGCPPAVKPDVLRMQRDRRVLFEQYSPRLSWASADVEKSEAYFVRTIDTFVGLRTALSDHHPDISTRDFQRGIMSLERALSIALRSRSRLSMALNKVEQLLAISSRYRMIMDSKFPFTIAPQALQMVSTCYDFTCRCANAVEEIIRCSQDIVSPSGDPLPISPVTLTRLDAILNDTRCNGDKLCSLQNMVSLTKTPILLRNEEQILHDALSQIDSSIASMQQLSCENDDLSHLINPTYAWMLTLREKITAFEISADSVVTVIDAGSVTNAMLSIVQDLYRHSESTKIAELDADNHIQRALALFENVDGLIRVEFISTKLDCLLASCVPNQRMMFADALTTTLPYLDVYAAFVSRHLTNFISWNKGIFKLVHVLSSLMKRLAEDGFCKPSTTEQSEGGQPTDGTEGVGFGEGVGEENVSNEVEAESQVEGLKGETAEGDRKEDMATSDDAIEMPDIDDMDAELEDVPDIQEGDDSGSDDNTSDLDEQFGQGQDNSLGEVDEAFWQDPEDGRDQQDSTDPASEPKDKPSGDASKNTTDKSAASDGTEATKPTSEEQPSEVPDHPGEPISDSKDDFNNQSAEEQVDMIDPLDMTDPLDTQLEEDEKQTEMESDDDVDQALQHMDESTLTDDYEMKTEAQDDRQSLQSEGDPHPDDDAVSEDSTELPGHSADLQDGGDGHQANHAVSQAGQARGDNHEDVPPDQFSQENIPKQDVPAVQDPQNNSSDTGVSDAADGFAQGAAPSVTNDSSWSNSYRDLTESLQDIRKELDEIQAAQSRDAAACAPLNEAKSLPEHAQLDHSSTMEALGPTKNTQVGHLNDMDIERPVANMSTEDDFMEIDDPSLPPGISESMDASQEPESGAKADNENAGEVDIIPVHEKVIEANQDRAVPVSNDDRPSGQNDVDSISDVEKALRHWRLRGQTESNASQLWKLYDSLTNELSIVLCEQLRLIMDPTKATRLKGDYRTGKRLNMKKIIPYIASDFTKDKIWLRRTRPSQREYQILVALDDSRSMAESHSIHLAFQALALVSKALNRLEVGDIAIAKFGEKVDVLHSFDDEPFTDAAGAKLFSALRFDQNATDMFSLLETSQTLLTDVRERRAMQSNSAAQLWQLEIIISDGVCQDHDKLAALLRRAQENQIFIVLLIIDAILPETGDENVQRGTAQTRHSILDMNQVTYATVNGRLELQMRRYLDTFPFEFFAVVKDVETLPDVLSGILKQFFERISEDS